MGYTKDYATLLYEWLSEFAPTFRSPVLSTMFDENNPRPSEYIEYSANAGNFNTDFMQAITLYSISTSYSRLMDIVDDMENAITDNGAIISADWGYITIYKGSPFYQDKPDEDDNIRAGYVNMIIRINRR